LNTPLITGYFLVIPSFQILYSPFIQRIVAVVLHTWLHLGLSNFCYSRHCSTDLVFIFILFWKTLGVQLQASGPKLPQYALMRWH